MAAAAVVLISGCAAPSPTTRVVFPGVTVNRRDGVFLVDTGSDSAILDGGGAARLQVKARMLIPDIAVNGKASERIALSEAVPVEVGSENFEAQFPIDTPPRLIRWLISSDFDGLIGWPEVRDNILVFNPDRRIITGADKLPEAASGWTKLGVGETDVFTLEVKKADGSTGKVLVDTGDPMGVGLTTDAWRAWRMAHPKARLVPRVFATPGIGILERDEGWADAIDVGNLHLTDVPVYEVPAAQAQEIDHYAGTLGMYALSRMDLVVDAKNHMAYANPRPPPGPAYPGVKRPNAPAASRKGALKSDDWIIADGVSLKQDSFLVQGARYKIFAKDFDGAIADCNRALAMDSKNLDAYLTRGSARDGKEDYDGALEDLGRVIDLAPDHIAARAARAKLHVDRDEAAEAVNDFDKLVKLEPQDPDAWAGRGEAQEVLGRFMEALADFNQAANVAKDDSNYFVLYAELLQLRMGSGEPDFAKTVSHWKRGWSRTLGEFVLGNIDEKTLLFDSRNSDEEPVSGQQCEAYYFIGMKRLLNGDKDGAREYFEKSVAMDEEDYYEYRFAKGELARMGVKPKSKGQSPK